MKFTRTRYFSCYFLLFLTRLSASPSLSVNLTGSLSSPALVGVPITFTALAAESGENSDPLDYRFSVSQNGSNFQVIVDFNSYPTFTWTPFTQEGSYIVQVTARDKLAGLTASAQLQFNVQSKAIGGQPVVTATDNPLVALYSAPPCPAGSSISVLFQSNAVELDGLASLSAEPQQQLLHRGNACEHHLSNVVGPDSRQS